jgi:hypothetical protein
MVKAPRWFSSTRLPLRHVIGGAVLMGAIGGLAGLIVGLLAYPPTARFAVFELGAPSAVLGGLLGLISAVITKGFRTTHHSESG